MQRFLAIGAVLLVSSATAPAARAAGLDLTANGCNTGSGVSALTFACENPAYLVDLVGCFQLPTAIDSLIGVDVSLDVEVETATLPNYWQFDACNVTGMSLLLSEPLTGCGGVPNLWGPGGTNGDGTRAYLSFYGGRPKRGRLIAFLTWNQADPVDVAAETNMLAFRFAISTVNATESGGACAGCATPTVIVWNSADFHSIAASQPEPLTVFNAGLVGQCVRLNGASPTTCAATPARNLTWGRLKAMYR